MARFDWKVAVFLALCVVFAFLGFDLAMYGHANESPPTWLQIANGIGLAFIAYFCGHRITRRLF